jgi:hypothetical protein
MVPFAEVIVTAATGLDEGVVAVTDVDVLGIDLGRYGSAQRLLFDCKTASKQSAINRALWAGGLKALVHADRAFVVLRKSAPDTHRLVAHSFDVHLHSEDSFKRYAAAVAPGFLRDITYLDDLDLWDQLIALRKGQPALAEAVAYVTTRAALERSAPKGMRAGLAALLKVAGELDPAKPLHQLLFRAYISSFLIFLSKAAGQLTEVFQFSTDKAQFEQRLRYFVWEGRENYALRQRLSVLIEKAKGETPENEFNLPAWDRFTELMRSFIDAPEALSSLSLISKEIAFRGIAKATRQETDDHLRQLFRSNNRARQFIFATTSYLVGAASLPKQFETALTTEINSLLDGGSSTLI